MRETEGKPASLDADIAQEQRFVNQAYATLDTSRHHYRQAQREVEKQGAWGTPQARSERDAMAAHYGDQASRLEQIEDRLVFGRIDMDDDTHHYIGRAGLRGSNGERLLVDWRAPAARPFYQATAVASTGVLRRRHISTHMREVRSIEDEILDARNAHRKGLVFQGEGALMSALSEAREGHMSDIVATIQAEQDAVIRAPESGILVVQGGPGTGKTAVALHRAAYLLYTDRERLERSGVLVVGPSRVFLRYIEQVLPSLGETGVVSLTISDLVPGFSPTAVESPDVTDAKGSLAWVATLREAVRSLQRLPKEDFTFDFDGRPATLTVSMVTAARTRARRSGRAHNEARNGFALELVEELAKQLAGEDADPETIQWWREEVRDNINVRREINLCWMPTSATTLLARLYSRPKLLTQVSRGLTSAEQKKVFRPTTSAWTNADVPLLDELEELLGTSQVLEKHQQAREKARRDAEVSRAQDAIDSQGLGGGIITAEVLASRALGEIEWRPLADRAKEDRTWTYGHIVVDEAQDLTPMGWHCLLRRCPSRSFTVVGDLDQRRGYNRPSSWVDSLGPAARSLTGEFALTVSYRTPKVITDLAQAVMEEVGEPTRFPITSARNIDDALGDTEVTEKEELYDVVKRVIAEEERRLDKSVGKGRGKVGVIVGIDRAQQWQADTTGASTLNQRVSLLSVPAAKGLEFDTVVVVEPTEILADGPGDLFVAMTRPTQRLHSVHCHELPQVWRKSLTERIAIRTDSTR